MILLLMALACNDGFHQDNPLVPAAAPDAPTLRIMPLVPTSEQDLVATRLTDAEHLAWANAVLAGSPISQLMSDIACDCGWATKGCP